MINYGVSIKTRIFSKFIGNVWKIFILLWTWCEIIFSWENQVLWLFWISKLQKNLQLWLQKSFKINCAYLSQAEPFYVIQSTFLVWFHSPYMLETLSALLCYDKLSMLFYSFHLLISFQYIRSNWIQ